MIRFVLNFCCPHFFLHPSRDCKEVFSCQSLHEALLRFKMPLHQRMMRRIKSLVASVQSVAQVDSSRVSFKLRNRTLQEDDTYESLRMGSQERVLHLNHLLFKYFVCDSPYRTQLLPLSTPMFGSPNRRNLVCK